MIITISLEYLREIGLVTVIRFPGCTPCREACSAQLYHRSGISGRRCTLAHGVLESCDTKLELIAGLVWICKWLGDSLDADPGFRERYLSTSSPTH